MRYDDIQTDFINIGPVNKTMNMLAMYHAEGEGAHLEGHRRRLADYLFLAPDGMKMQGYNGCQLWDTSFAMQAFAATKLHESPENDIRQKMMTCLDKGYDYVDMSQVVKDYPNRDEYYHHLSKGAWPFSTRDHGWPIADCTSEGLRAILDLDPILFGNTNSSSLRSKKLSRERIDDAVACLLSYQNSDGGFPTYELKRTGGWMELLNPSEVFGEIMVDYSYVELTAAVLRALVAYVRRYPDCKQKGAIRKSVSAAVEYLFRIQRKDGSWRGSWGVCFTYGTWFGVEGLQMVMDEFMDGKDPKIQASIINACDFLVKKQNKDGGWGEDFQSCVRRCYVDNENGSQVVNTGWALLALMASRLDKYDDSVNRGIELLMKRQLSTGDWALENISGVFNGNCSISYNSYKNVFPMWALGVYVDRYRK
eukprot:TRINITY_DN5215_c0_g1_i1.p1 TRINITY_DN5215_c0_g1~~TRINITY_DN5215_c0_g1_i1.p1  ORF type:complete len:422 (+),score=65.09 TRINITY_DN5215_c0_g1_i1:33-1298(+)